jgi:hypothetical protein
VKLLSLTGHPTARPAGPGNNEGGAGLLLVWRSVAAASNWLSLDSVVAKRRAGRYLPSDRAWVKTKNRDYWRWELEREGVLKAPATIRLGQASRVYIRAWPVRTLPRCAISAQLDDICHRVPTRRDLRPLPSTHRWKVSRGRRSRVESAAANPSRLRTPDATAQRR